MTYEMNDFYNDVYTFNKVAGRFDNVTLASVNEQTSFNYEEAVEIITAIEEEKSDVKLLDGYVDNLFTAIGGLQMLAAKGFDVELALKKVAENNLSKYLKEPPIAIPVGQKVEYNREYDLFVMKDGNNKVKKPSTYKDVELSDCVPAKGFFK